jgi:metal-responsive CopG/Arc/MetJ family transcriptional regulator
MKTAITSIKLQKKLHHKLQQTVINDEYGMRGKNKWILEAIESFLALPDYPHLVDLADQSDQLTDIISLRFSDTLMRKLDEAVIHVRRQYPAMEGVKSNLIRASIIQRLIRCSTSVTE